MVSTGPYCSRHLSPSLELAASLKRIRPPSGGIQSGDITQTFVRITSIGLGETLYCEAARIVRTDARLRDSLLSRPLHLQHAFGDLTPMYSLDLGLICEVP